MVAQIKVFYLGNYFEMQDKIILGNALAKELNATKIDYIPASLLNKAKLVIHYETKSENGQL